MFVYHRASKTKRGEGRESGGNAEMSLYADMRSLLMTSRIQKENAAIRASQEQMQNKLFAAEGKLKSLEEINTAKEEQVG